MPEGCLSVRWLYGRTYRSKKATVTAYDENGKKFTFGLLHSIFKDALVAKRKSEIKVGVIKAIHRVVPMALAPFFPILAITGYIFGTSRAFNKIIIYKLFNRKTLNIICLCKAVKKLMGFKTIK